MGTVAPRSKTPVFALILTNDAFCLELSGCCLLSVAEPDMPESSKVDPARSYLPSKGRKRCVRSTLSWKVGIGEVDPRYPVWKI